MINDDPLDDERLICLAACRRRGLENACWHPAEEGFRPCEECAAGADAVRKERERRSIPESRVITLIMSGQHEKLSSVELQNDIADLLVGRVCSVALRAIADVLADILLSADPEDTEGLANTIIETITEAVFEKTVFEKAER